jgi:septum formation protein
MPVRKVLLASASASRLRLLQDSGIQPYVQVSAVDEDAISNELSAKSVSGIEPAYLVEQLAIAKGEAVARDITVTAEKDLIIIAADSMLEFEGVAYGKPGTPEKAKERWQAMRGKSGYLHSGHWIKDLVSGEVRTGVAGARIHFGEVSDEEIDHYVSSGEPLGVAGAFTHEGRSAAFISAIEGDVAAVAGMSMYLIRTLLAEIGISWTEIWDN